MNQEDTIKEMKHFCMTFPNFSQLLGYEKMIKQIIEHDEIIKLVHDLDWNLSKQIQESAVSKLVNQINSLDTYLLIHPFNKCTWHNAVRVIELLGYPKNKNALPSLIYLLQDLNWPGNEKGMNILSKIDRNELIPLLEIAIKDSFNANDLTWLAGIKHFLDLFPHQKKCRSS